MKSQYLIATSFAALVIAAASLLTTESAHAGFGRGGIGGMSHMGGARMGGVSRMGNMGGGMSRMSSIGGMNRMGSMSRMGGVSRVGGLSHGGGISRMGNVQGARGLGMAKHGDSHVARGNFDKGAKSIKVADRDVGGKMKEKAGTATHDAKGRPIGGYGTDPNGTTTSSYKNGNGTHDIKVADKDGKTVSTGSSGKEPTGGSVTAPNGTTTTWNKNADGTRTITRTDANGNTTSTTSGKPAANANGASVDDGKGGFKPYEPKKEPVGGSSTNPDTGVTTTSVRNPDGKHSVTTTNGDRDAGGGMRDRGDGGRRHDRGDRPVVLGGDVVIPVGLPVVPFDPPSSGSTVFDGETIKVTGIGTPAHTVTKTDKDGNTTVKTDPPPPALPPVAGLGDAFKNLADAAAALAAAQAESKSAHRSLDSIVGVDNPSDAIKAQIPDAIDRAREADKAVKDAKANVQKAMGEFQQQFAEAVQF